MKGGSKTGNGRERTAKGLGKDFFDEWEARLKKIWGERVKAGWIWVEFY
jgi:hypothetical protein